MLLRFGTSNHRSIREYQELVFTATSLKDSDSGLLYAGQDTPVGSSSEKSRLRVVPVVAIYGSNAAGKSTVLKALTFFVDAIIYSHNRVASQEGTPYAPFLLDDESRGSPSKYDADFVLGDARYHYGFTLDGRRILSEWLYSFPLNGKRQTKSVLFHRDCSEDEEYYFGKSLKGDNKRISRFARENGLFLSAAAQSSHPQLSFIYEYFLKKVSKRFDQTDNLESVGKQLFAYFGSDTERRSRAVSFLKAADVGISGVDFSQVPIEEKTRLMIQEFEQFLSKHLEDESLSIAKEDKRTKVKLLHAGIGGRDYAIKLKDESSGTLALLQILGPVFSRLNEGGLLIVDELNISLHPLVSRELIRLFSSPSTNPGGAQLIFSTHDTSMLVSGFLRRDQIWFAEKDKNGCTVIYSLSSMKIRGDDNFERGYIDGRFGAIPIFGLRDDDFLRLGSASGLEER